ncbi:MAG: metal-dependent hydrolase, beta-lactamase superfamily [Actinomycetia bacterium]|jgi:ribonuclease Z|nr:metal-dependent hydrolase, beta-lactamase superfamily [Actinomycetes bacterium]
MDVTLLGTGCPLPDPNRAGPATLVRAGGHALLFDAGRGVLMRLAGAGLPSPAFLSRLFLTHLHSDHITDVNDVITMRWAMSPTPNLLPVIGPPGTKAFIDRTIDMLVADIGFRVAHHADLTWEPACEVHELTEGVAWEADGVRVVAAPTDHRPVSPTVGYRIEHDGAAVVIAGDTVPCDSLTRLCEGADVYVQTVIRTDLVRSVPSPRLHDILDYHSSVEDAGRTAAKAGVRTLVLTHPVPPPAPGTEDEWVALAAAHFDGEVVLAHDLMTVAALAR